MKTRYLPLLSLALWACGGTDTGNPVDTSSEGGSDGGGEVEAPLREDCEERPRELAPDEPTPLGVTGAEVLGMAAGEWQLPLEWARDVGQDPELYLGPESGDGELGLVLQPTGGLRYIERDPRPSSVPGRPNFSTCEDLIEADVALELSTPGGALNERLDTRLRAMSADIAYGQVKVPLESLNGSLTAEVARHGYVAAGPATVELGLAVTPHGIAGGIVASQSLAVVGTPAPRRSYPFSASVAIFSSSAQCEGATPVPDAAAVRSASVPEAIEGFNAWGPAPVRVGNEERGELTYTLERGAGTTCLRFSQDFPSQLALNAPVTLILNAPDAGLLGSVAATLSVSSLAGAPDAVRVSADVWSRDPARFPVLAAQFGILEPIDFSGYAAVHYSLDGGFSDDTSSGGSLRVTGEVDEPCVTANGIQCPGRLVTLRDLHWSKTLEP